MPLGLGRSILSKAAPAAAASGTSFDLGVFNSNELGSGSNGAGLLLDAGSGNTWPIDNRRMTLSVWVKGTTSDLPTDNKIMLFRQLTSTDSGFFVQVQNNGTECFFQRSGAGGNKGILSFPTNFETDVWDDEWHHLLWYVDTNSTQTASNAFYVDGVAQTLDQDSNGITAAITQHRYGKHNSNDNTTADNTDYYDSRSGTVKMAQLWLDFGYNGHDTDFSKFYDSGPVYMGGDGTLSGLSQPDIFIHQVGGREVQDGGSQQGTVSVINEGSGSYNFANTGGPTGTHTETAFYSFSNDATQPTSSGFTLNKAATYTVSHSTAPYVSSKTFSGVFWFRLAQEAGNIDSPASRFIYMTDSDQSDLWGFVFGSTTNLSYMNVLRSDGNRLIKPYGSSYAANSNFMSAIADGAWHCIMISMNDPFETATSSWFIDGSGTNEVQSSGPTLTTNINSSDFKYVMLRNNNGGHNLNYGTTFESGPGFQLGPIWLYDSYIDFTDSANRAYFYDSTKTDGFVYPGVDGTAGGAPLPDFFCYHDANTLRVSSAQTSTVNEINSNSGAITVINKTDGPGSGGTN